MKEVTGLEELMRELNKEAGKIKGKTMKGYIEAAIVIRRSTERDEPTVPVDTGNLRNSFFTTTGRTGSSGSFKSPKAGELSAQHSAVKAKYKAEADKDPQPMMILGFSANYASDVHENMDPRVRRNRPGSGPKFLETSIDSNKLRILNLLRENAEIK